MSVFITFEGIEGCGKTTQVRLLANSLRRCGLDVLTTREPGGCPIADDVRRILLNPDNSALVPRAELLLYAAARAQHVAEVIQPALARGSWVLCDRFADATLAYQGYGRGLGTDLIEMLNEVAAGPTHPQLTILFDLPVEEGLSRARERNSLTDGPSEGRFEEESLAFHRRVREGYLTLVDRAPERFLVVDARGERDAVAGRVRNAVAERLDMHGLLK
ncbi:MAG TPA: dTMP kinase [Desulfuromonadales bacterium]|nr:dTMP kinase [Desulfuromonadales bacterium]